MRGKIFLRAILSCIVALCPISGCGEKPDHNANWYYYWEKDNVIPGLDRAGSPASRWDWSVDAANEGVYGAAHGPSDGYVLTDRNIRYPEQTPILVSHKTNPLLRFRIGAATTFGIEMAAGTMAHEKKHIENYKFRTSPGQVDTDRDGLADSLENIAPYFFIIGDRDTYDLQNRINQIYADYGEDEFMARMAEPAGVAAAKKDEDWSRGGTQWRH